LISRTVACDERGVVMSEWNGSAETETRLAWDEVGLVAAYKRDCYTVDQMRIAIADRAERVCIDISEEDDGYRALIAALPKYLPGCLASKEGFTQVAFPAFETNWTVLHRRSGES
jgi:hypothetical protein